MERIFLVSNLFNENNGAYATFGNNIVHETINFFKADDGYIYFYIPPRGTIGKEYQKNDTKISLIITCGYGEKTLKVLYYAENVEYLTDNGTEIEYGKQPLEKIFSNNITKDNNKDTYNNHITFKTTELKVPDTTILLTNISETNISNTYFFHKKLRNRSMRCYFNAIDDKEDFEIINDLITQTKWKDAKLSTVNDYTPHYTPITFFDIIGKEDNELAFSNIFAYFFNSYPDLLSEFLNKSLKIKLNSKFTIEREKNRIDLYITDGNTRIIIENKIKSGINGIKDDNTSQLSKYIDSVIEDNITDNIVADNLHCIIFRPEYASLNRYKNYLTYNYQKHDINKKFTYSEISYKQIYDFYSDKQNCILENDKLFYDLFLDAMKKHTKKTDTDIEDRMKLRFVQRINDLNKSK